jgi:ligand-binding sensor domain-containing protein
LNCKNVRGVWYKDKDGKIKTYTVKDGLISNDIRAICEDNDGSIWIGTYTAGVSVLKNNRFTNYNKENGLSRRVMVGGTFSIRGILITVTKGRDVCL